MIQLSSSAVQERIIAEGGRTEASSVLSEGDVDCGMLAHPSVRYPRLRNCEGSVVQLGPTARKSEMKFQIRVVAGRRPATP